MKGACLLALVFLLVAAANVGGALAQGAAESGPRTATLHALNKYPDRSGTAAFSFKTGTFGREGDLYYGTLYVNEDHDWLQVSTSRGARTAFRDLGAHGWADSFDVPVVEPFPKLKEGEQRHVTVDTSGADGEDGAPGAPGADADGVVRAHPPAAPPRPSRPKHDGVPKVDPIFAKAVVGHVYVMRVVDDEEDFYVLFRVESLVRGDNCTITWKRVPAPRQQGAARAGGK